MIIICKLSLVTAVCPMGWDYVTYIPLFSVLSLVTAVCPMGWDYVTYIPLFSVLTAPCINLFVCSFVCFARQLFMC